MAFYVSMPKLGMTMTEGTISEWKKKEGDAVAVGDPLFDVETDKLTNTINAYEAGTVLKILVNDGETAACQQPVAIMGQAGEDISGLTGAAAAPAEEKTEQPAEQSVQPAAHKAGERLIISPRAKKVAAELGIDTHYVTGTGPNGRIVERDIRNYKPAAQEEPTRIMSSAAQEEATRVMPARPHVEQAASFAPPLEPVEAGEQTRILDARNYQPAARAARPDDEGTRVMPAAVRDAAPAPQRAPEPQPVDEEDYEEEADSRDSIAETLIRWVPPITAIICAGIALWGFVYYQFIL